MKLWPEKKHQLQQIILVLLILLGIGLLLYIMLFWRFFNLSRKPSFTDVSGYRVKNQAFGCPQRVDGLGWQIVEGLVRTFPRCLTVSNSRFGSRFNFDWYFADQKVASSVLGNLEDKDSFFTLRLGEGVKLAPVFPAGANPVLNEVSVDLGLTYQKNNFADNDLSLSLNVISPFAASPTFLTENTKLSTAPVFILDLTVANKTDLQRRETISLSLGNAGEIKSLNNLDVIYFPDGSRRDGLRALAARSGNPNLTPFIQAGQGGFSWKVNLAGGQTAKISLFYAGFLAGDVITDTRQEGKKLLKFAYHYWFSGIDEVLSWAEANETGIRQKTDQFEAEVRAQNLPAQKQWLLAQAFHSYLGNSFLVTAGEGSDSLAYFVWEGEFKFLNTLDVAHDYGVLEGLYFPWVLPLELDSWRESAKKDEKGTVIPHDVGSQFSFKGVQEYGIEGSQTSGMPVEENANFILLSYWYWVRTQDTVFARKIAPFIKDLLVSLKNRDTNENGIADVSLWITTYDNDGNSALYKAPDSAYLGLKQLSAYVSAAKIFSLVGDSEAEKLANKEAQLISTSFEKAYQDKGFIPLTFDPNFKETSQFEGKTIKGREEQGFAFVTGLFYPAITKLDSPYLNQLLPILTDSYRQAYQKSLVKNETGEVVGLQLAQYQALALGWLSHSVMADVIAAKLFGQTYDSSAYYFPLLYDNPSGFTDGQYFKPPWYPPLTTLLFYPRGAALFSWLL